MRYPIRRGNVRSLDVGWCEAIGAYAVHVHLENSPRVFGFAVSCPMDDERDWPRPDDGVKLVLDWVRGLLHPAHWHRLALDLKGEPVWGEGLPDAEA